MRWKTLIPCLVACAAPPGTEAERVLQMGVDVAARLDPDAALQAYLRALPQGDARCPGVGPVDNVWINDCTSEQGAHFEGLSYYYPEGYNGSGGWWLYGDVSLTLAEGEHTRLEGSIGRTSNSSFIYGTYLSPGSDSWLSEGLAAWFMRASYEGEVQVHGSIEGLDGEVEQAVDFVDLRMTATSDCPVQLVGRAGVRTGGAWLDVDFGDDCACGSSELGEVCIDPSALMEAP